MKKFLMAISLFLTAACQQNAPSPINQTAKPIVTTTTNVSSGNSNSVNTSSLNNSSVNTLPPNSNSDKSKIKTFNGKGVVTKINLELGSVALDHEEIKGLMPAMEGMEFYVSDKKMLDGLKIGDKTDFVLEDNAGAERIINIRKN